MNFVHILHVILAAILKMGAILKVLVQIWTK